VRGFPTLRLLRPLRLTTTTSIAANPAHVYGQVVVVPTFTYMTSTLELRCHLYTRKMLAASSLPAAGLHPCNHCQFRREHGVFAP